MNECWLCITCYYEFVCDVFRPQKRRVHVSRTRSAPPALTLSRPDAFLCVMCVAHGARVTTEQHVYTHSMAKFTPGHDPSAPDDGGGEENGA
ncbi:uncharacterized protein BXZ73DRAFT_104860 [Epithele typhae]|uniref:uncharacterized protein n=1 Tax=Epithele typhae TaxID=378194 RepID=UPI0020088A46|nr:uncharacterized protein BXZ73DRAFT_104860 [Epithele typhae]KAH9919754.1 hypothetical protein BXZ73DRAFT_104860 [Epithele typhae]